MSRQNMRAGLTMRFERSPDYFALLNAHTPSHATWLVRDRQELKGLCSICTRPGYVDGQPQAVAYLAELRFAFGRRTSGLWYRIAQALLPHVARETGATLGYCSIIAGNRLAQASILRRAAKSDLRLAHLRAYSTISIVARKPRFMRRGHASPREGIEVRRADERDHEPLRRFLDAESRHEQFGVRFDAQTWSTRLKQWPLELGDFRLALDSNQTIIGCAAPWDSSAINRIVIDRLPPRAELLRRLVNLAAPITGRPVVGIGPGSHLPDIALTHLKIVERRVDVFAALLDAIYQDVASTRRYATVSLCLYEGDPLRGALDDYVCVDTPMDLFWLKLDSAAAGLRDRHRYPGFEHYLV